jgi:hypothetical protein
MPRHRDAGGARTLHDRLLRAGIRTVLHKAHSGSGALISFIITARHTFDDIDHAATALSTATAARMTTPVHSLTTG